MKTMNKRIEELQKQIGNVSEVDSPTLVFIDEVPDGYRVIEDYVKRNARGEIIKGAKRKQYTTTESLETIRSRYSPHTRVLQGGVID